GAGTGAPTGTPSGGGASGTGVGPTGAAGTGQVTGVAGNTGAAGGPCTQGAALAAARVGRPPDPQYGHVVSQEFGVRPPSEVPQADTAPADYANFSEAPELTVQANTVSAYQVAAHNAAYSAVTANLRVFLPCSTSAPSDACVEQFVHNRVARAFGRP